MGWVFSWIFKIQGFFFAMLPWVLFPWWSSETPRAQHDDDDDDDDDEVPGLKKKDTSMILMEFQEYPTPNYTLSRR